MKYYLEMGIQDALIAIQKTQNEPQSTMELFYV
jgi:hypothetical protein